MHAVSRPVEITDLTRSVKIPPSDPVKTNVAGVYNYTQFTNGGALTFSSWVRGYSQLPLFQIVNPDSGLVCLQLGPRVTQQGTNKAFKTLQPWALSWGMHKYQKLLAKNEALYWQLYELNIGETAETVDETGRVDFYNLRHYPAQIVLEHGINTSDKDATDWLTDGKWHHVAVALNLTNVQVGTASYISLLYMCKTDQIMLLACMHGDGSQWEVVGHPMFDTSPRLL
jgi:hypothetical protein